MSVLCTYVHECVIVLFGGVSLLVEIYVYIAEVSGLCVSVHVVHSGSSTLVATPHPLDDESCLPSPVFPHTYPPSTACLTSPLSPPEIAITSFILHTYVHIIIL